MSVVLRPSGGKGDIQLFRDGKVDCPLFRPAHVTALTAVAAAQAIEAVAGRSTEIRWPNDVTLGGRKVAGILTECRGSRVAPCVVGIGINANTQRGEFPPDLQASATSLAIEAGRDFAIESVAGAALRFLAERYRDALDGRWDAVAEQWRRRASLLGRLVTIRSNGRAFDGRLVATDPVGGIELELPGGGLRRFRAEDTTLAIASTQ